MAAAIIALKVIHIVSLLFWAASLFYLPGLLALHHDPHEQRTFYRLRAFTRMVFLAIASPAAVIAIASGTALIQLTGSFGGWLVLKLAAVAGMVAFHVHCGTLVMEMREPPFRWRRTSLLSLLIVPSVLVPAVLYLVLAQPL